LTTATPRPSWTRCATALQTSARDLLAVAPVIEEAKRSSVAVGPLEEEGGEPARLADRGSLLPLRLVAMVRVTMTDGRLHERSGADGVSGTIYPMVSGGPLIMVVLTKDSTELMGNAYRFALPDVKRIDVEGPSGPTDLLGVPIAYR
jgi:hypothetical protein